jgi:dihydrofolate synthase / folylpolyglutamate synthase
MPRFAQLSDWLAWQETLHPNAIDLGLERVRAVMQRLGLEQPACPVITIAGTKGKGSCAALLESLLRAGGYRVGLFTSPHLRRYNERIRIAAAEISDASLCAAFARIDAARAEISLTYFEFNALAALLCFESAAVDVWILEVGMGGRLDAVNVIDADVAIITSIGLDHTEWLGNDLNSIAREKAGICRAGRPVLFGSLEMPAAISEVANEQGAQLLRAGLDFSFQRDADTATWIMGAQQLQGLPLPALPGEVQLANAGCALTALQLLKPRLPLTRAAIERGLQQAHLDGRLQLIQARAAEWLLDVAHNAMSASVLAAHLATLSQRRTLAIIGVMADKDLDSMVSALRPQVMAWLAVDLPSARALSALQLSARLRAAGVLVMAAPPQLSSAFDHAEQLCITGKFDRVLVFGSFLTVGPALEWLALDG